MALSEGRSEDTLPEVNKSPESPYGSVAHTSHSNGGSAHTPLHDSQRYFHYIPRHPIYTSRRNESPARPHHRPTHHLRSGLPPHPAETSSSDLVGNPHTLHVILFHAMRPYYIRCKHLEHFSTSSMSVCLSPISNSAAHPLKFYWVRISLRCTTAHPLLTLASKPIVLAGASTSYVFYAKRKWLSLVPQQRYYREPHPFVRCSERALPINPPRIHFGLSHGTACYTPTLHSASLLDIQHPFGKAKESSLLRSQHSFAQKR